MAVAPDSSLLGLQSLDVDGLRALATRHLSSNAPTDRQGLLAALSSAASSNPTLLRSIKTGAVSIKPSFFLMAVTPTQGSDPSDRAAAGRKIRGFTEDLNVAAKKRSKTPSTMGWTLEEVNVSRDT